MDEIDGLGENQGSSTGFNEAGATSEGSAPNSTPGSPQPETAMAAAEAEAMGTTVSEQSDLLIKHMDVISDAISEADLQKFDQAVGVIRDALGSINGALQGIPNTEGALNGLQDATSSYITAAKSFYKSPEAEAYAKKYTDTQREFSAALKQLLFQVTRRNRLVGRSLSRGFSKRSLTQNLRNSVMTGASRVGSSRGLNSPSTTPPPAADQSGSLSPKISEPPKPKSPREKSPRIEKSPRSVEPGQSATAEDVAPRVPAANDSDKSGSSLHARRPSRSVSSIETPIAAKPVIPPKPTSLLSSSSDHQGSRSDSGSPREGIPKSPRTLERENTVGAPKTKESRDRKDSKGDKKKSKNEDDDKKKDKKDKKEKLVKEKKPSKKKLDGDLTSSKDSDKKAKLTSTRSNIVASGSPDAARGLLKRHKTLNDDVGGVPHPNGTEGVSPRLKLVSSVGASRDAAASSDSDAESSMSSSNPRPSAPVAISNPNQLALPDTGREMRRINSSELLGEISSRRQKKEDDEAANHNDIESSLIDDSRDEDEDIKPQGSIRPTISELPVSSIVPAFVEPGSPLTPQKRSTENEKQLIANRIIASFCERFPSFKAEWESADPMKKVLSENKIVSELAMYQISMLKTGPPAQPVVPIPTPTIHTQPASAPNTPPPSAGTSSMKLAKISAKEKAQKSMTNVGISSSTSSSETKKAKKSTTPTSLRLWPDDKGSPSKDGISASKSGSPRTAAPSMDSVNEEQLETELMRYASMKPGAAPDGSMTMKLKGGFMSLLGRSASSSPSSERAPAPTKLPVDVLAASKAFCNTAVIGFLAELNIQASDPASYEGAKSQRLVEKQRTLVELIKTMIAGMRTLTNLPAGAGSVLGDLLTAVEEEAKQPRDGTMHEIDPKLLTECRYARLVRHNITKSITRWCIGLYHTAGQVGTDVVALSKLTSIDPDLEATTIHMLSMVSAFLNLLTMLMNDMITLHYAVTNSGANATPGVAPSQSPRYPSIISSGNSGSSLGIAGANAAGGGKSIWDESEPEPCNDRDTGVFRSGTLNQIIARVLTQPNDSLTDTLLDAYSAFTTASALLDRLLEAVTSLPAQKFDANKNIRILAGVCGITDRLVRAGIRYHFDDTCIPKIRVLLGELAKTSELGVTVQKIMALLAKDDDDEEFFVELPKEVQTYELDSSLPHTSILLFDAPVIAQQLTYIEFDIFKHISPDELKSQSWNKPKRMCVARNVCALIRRANRISMWVATSILLQPKVKDRVRVVLRIINVAKALKELGNYNTLMGIIAGLNMSCISRLKLTMAAVGRKPLDTLKNLQSIVDPTASFKTLRDTLRQGFGSSQLPYIGTTLTDLTFIEDGNPDFLTNEKTHQEFIHMEKHNLLSNAIRSTTAFQSSDFKISVRDPAYTFLHELPCLDEQLLYKLSLEREPRTNDTPTFKRGR